MRVLDDAVPDPDSDSGAAADPVEPGVEPVRYSVEPDIVECTDTVTLTVHADNPNREPAACRLISLKIELGEGESALTNHPNLIRPAPGRTTAWHVGVSSDGLWDCVPVPPMIGFGSEQRASFVLSRVVVNGHPGGPTCLRIDEQRGTEHREVCLPIMKLDPGPGPRATADRSAGTPPPPRSQ